jgi:DNA-binding protein YbaB
MLINAKIEGLKSTFQKDFPDRIIQYQFANELHKFRIEGKKPTHWLYISRELVEDSEIESLIDMLITNQIINTFKNAKKSKWLFLSSSGVREVDERFAK